MPIETTPNLNATERAAVDAEARNRNFSGTAEEFIHFYKWGQKDLEACVAEYREREAAFFKPFFDKALGLSTELRVAEALHIRNVCSDAGLDMSDLDALIATFEESSDAARSLVGSVRKG
jgi:hypothetical protein